MPAADHQYAKKTDKIYAYGTAGFREKYSELPFIMYRMGILAAIRSKAKYGKHIGIMVTASHNPEDYNGVKLIDPGGEMLEASWEPLATDLVNSMGEDLKSEIDKICRISGLSNSDYECRNAVVHCARDNRISGPDLMKAVQAGVASIPHSSYFDEGVLTTPQLHYVIKCLNYSEEEYNQFDNIAPNEQGYYNSFAAAFNALNRLISSVNLSDPNIYYVNRVHVDAANGVGGSNFAKLMKHVESGLLDVAVVNSGEGPLNEKCGADYVKLGRTFPQVYTSNVVVESMAKWASFDGDADRLVYYYVDADKRFHLLDGDKIAILFATYVGELLEKIDLSNDLKIGIVQTAYANGSSTRFIQTNLPHIHAYCVPTGVKHLHKQAEQLDVGIYFEANGHGTILFSERCKMTLKKMSENEGSGDDFKQLIAKQLLMFTQIINEAVGDAMTDLLAVETILKHKNWSISQWNALYRDVPSRQIKVKITDRNLIKTTNAERTCTEPSGLQNAIDVCVQKFNNARAFIRPSGTEDVVRVYAEADTEANVEALASQVASLVHKLAGGVDLVS